MVLAKLNKKQKALAEKIWERYRGATDALIGIKRGLHITGRVERAFLRAMQEAFAYHYLRSPEFQRLCRPGFLPLGFEAPGPVTTDSLLFRHLLEVSRSQECA